MKFLIDVGVGRVVERWLETTEHDVVTVRAIDPRLADYDILALASAEHRVSVTMDKDFGELVYHSKLAHAGVLLLRLGNADGETKRAVLETILANHLDELDGRFAVYLRGRLRVRP